jgi:hypothetical protein
MLTHHPHRRSLNDRLTCTIPSIHGGYYGYGLGGYQLSPPRCLACGKVGHIRADCRTWLARYAEQERRREERQRWHEIQETRRGKVCYYCGSSDHLLFSCPRRPADHSTTCRGNHRTRATEPAGKQPPQSAVREKEPQAQNQPGPTEHPTPVAGQIKQSPPATIRGLRHPS